MDKRVETVFNVLRWRADASGYGSMISDESLQETAEAIVKALDGKEEE